MGRLVGVLKQWPAGEQGKSAMCHQCRQERRLANVLGIARFRHVWSPKWVEP